MKLAMATSTMMFNARSQRFFLAALLVLDALATVVYVVIPGGMLSVTAASGATMPTIDIWQLALGNAAIILLGYGMIGLVGLWLANRNGLPGIVRTGAGWKALILQPLMMGAFATDCSRPVEYTSGQTLSGM